MDSKRIFDLFAASIGVAMSLPLLLGIALIIKLEDGGPVFYRGERIGRNGKPFGIFKFRTMTESAESTGISSTSSDDERVTRMGKVIRNLKLDEVAQLINVVKGDMSLVGPRPEVKKFVDKYSEEEKEILSVRPGITDWASIWNNDEGSVISKSGIADADEAYEKLLRPTKLQLQMKYVREHSLTNDVRIILRTLRAVLEKDHDVSDLAPPPGTI